MDDGYDAASAARVVTREKMLDMSVPTSTDRRRHDACSSQLDEEQRRSLA
jgi:hypothetical protein